MFGSAGFGRPVITLVHASPSKTGNNTEPVKDTACTQVVPRMALVQDATTPVILTAYPNPFTNDIKIDFTTPAKGAAKIAITDVTGREVETITHEAGTINIGKDLKAGIYYVTISQDGYNQVVKIVKE